jgi:hypothetical protein
LAATFAYYADYKKLPIYLAGTSPSWTPPKTPLSWWAILNYLAKVQQDGHLPLGQLLGKLPALPFVVVLVSHPPAEIAKDLATLAQRCGQVLAISINPTESDVGELPLPQRSNLRYISVVAAEWLETVKQL